MKIYNLEAFIISLVAMAIAVVMLALQRGEAAIWVGIITSVVGFYAKSPIDWQKKETPD